MLNDQELAALLAAATSSGRGDYPASGDVGKAKQALAALAPALAEELIRLRDALREVMEDHAWKDELWRFTDETEAVLAALAPTAEHETGEVGDGLL